MSLLVARYPGAEPVQLTPSAIWRGRGVITPPETASFLGISRQRVHQKIQSGRLQAERSSYTGDWMVFIDQFLWTPRIRRFNREVDTMIREWRKRSGRGEPKRAPRSIPAEALPMTYAPIIEGENLNSYISSKDFDAIGERLRYEAVNHPSRRSRNRDKT